MTNCPNCGAPLEPYSWKCAYCGTCYFDLDAWDLEHGKPTYIKFRTPQGTITALARPEIGTVEINSENSYYTDSHSNILKSYVIHRTCNINVSFSCYENPKTKALFQIDTRKK